MLLVSHDRTFLDNIVTSTLAFEGDGRVVEYVGGWVDYLRQRGSGSRGAAEKTGTARRGDQPSPAVVAPPAARPKKLSFKEQREFEDLPARIEALEDEQRRLTQESESAEFYKTGADHIRTVLSRLAALPGELEETLRRWLELEERAQRR